MGFIRIMNDRVSGFLRKNSGRTFRIPVEKQRRLIESFHEPLSLIERAYDQYVCQKLFFGNTYYFFANLAAVVLLPIQLLRFRMVKQNFLKPSQPDGILLLGENMQKNIFPTSLLDEYETKYEPKYFEGLLLTSDDWTFFESQMKGYWGHPFFLYKNLMKLASYSYFINKYSPAVIAACGGEFSFTSSFLTEYCHSHGIQHFNTMHGEMFYYTLDAFVAFDRFYVWDQHYIRLLRQLRTETGNCVIELPPSVKIDFSGVDVSGLEHFNLKYYLDNSAAEELHAVSETVHKLCKQGHKVCVRYHPRSANLDEITKAFDFVQIENPREVSLERSMMTTDTVVARFSTILFQAWKSGKRYIIDDVSFPAEYVKLKEVQYIMASRESPRLSELIRNDAVGEI